MSKKLVIGGHGFIGSHFSKALEKGTFDIYDTGNPNGWPSDYTINMRREGLPPSISKEELFNSSYSTVYHFGSLAGIRNGHQDIEFYQRNCKELIELIEGLTCVRFVYISSSSVLGDVETAYSMSKKLAEDIVKKMEIPTTIIRPFTVYGEYGRPEMFITKCIGDDKVTVLGNPKKIKRRFTYVGDLVECILNYKGNDTVNCIGQRSYTLSYILKLCGTSFKIEKESQYDFKNQTLDEAFIWLCKTDIKDKIKDIKKTVEVNSD